MLAVIGWVVLGLVVLVLALLAIPVEVRFDVSRRPTLEGEVQVSWLFGRVRGGSGEPPAEEPPAPGEPVDEGADPAAAAVDVERPGPATSASWRARRRQLRRILAAVRTPGLLTRLLRLLKQLLASARLELEGEGRFGFEDPADTGRAYGALAAATVWLPTPVPPPWIEPDFTGPRLEFEVRGRARIVPLRSLVPLVGFLLSPVALRAAWRATRAGSRPWRGEGSR